MRNFIIILLFTQVFTHFAYAQSEQALNSRTKILNSLDDDLDWSIYNDVEIREFFFRMDQQRRQTLLNNIKSSKLSLFNGNVQGAIELLNLTLIKYQDTPFIPIIQRYLALAHFTIGDFKTTYKILSKDIFLTNEYYDKICVLRVASMLHLEKNNTLKLEMNRCQNRNFAYTKTRFRWFKYLNDEFFEKIKANTIDPKFYDNKVFATKKFTSLDETRSWLKYVILFNIEDLAAEYFHFLPDAAFQDDVIRTLMGYVLYIANKDEKAKEFIEDINNSNSSYLKALLEAKKGEFKTSYAHSMSANKRRPFSINNSQLLTAISWLTENWKNARLTSSKVVPPASHTREQKLLKTALLIQEGNFYRAQREIEELYFLYNKKMPFEALIIESYIYLTLKDSKWLKSSDTACLRYDGMNCWLHLQSLIWNDYAETVSQLKSSRTKVIDTIKKLTTKKVYSPIRENIFIRQGDILELDIARDPQLEDVRILQP